MELTVGIVIVIVIAVVAMMRSSDRAQQQRDHERYEAEGRSPSPVAVARSPSQAVIGPSLELRYTLEIGGTVVREAPARTIDGAQLGLSATFFGAGRTLKVGSYSIESPLAYAATSQRNADASTIDTSLKIGSPKSAHPLPYWPSYKGCTPAQRATYLEWLATGRSQDVPEIGYIFLFFYGMERRALVDRSDRELVHDELVRLMTLYGGRSGSFDRYSSELLAFLICEDLGVMTEMRLEELRALCRFDGVPLQVSLAWHIVRQHPLQARWARVVASRMDGARRSVVLKRASAEFEELFDRRYQEMFGDGLKLQSAKKLASLRYHTASASLHASGLHFAVNVPDILGRPAQLIPLVNLWNSCLEDLKKLSSARRKAQEVGGDDGAVTVQMWEALPPELRAETDHPLRDKWASLVDASPRAGAFHLLTAKDLADALSPDVTGNRVTPAKARALAETLDALSFGVEPDPRLTNKGLAGGDPVVVWCRRSSSLPEPQVYQACSGLMALLLAIVTADGVVDDSELEALEDALETLFPVDPDLLERLRGLREVMLRAPARASAMAKRIRENKSREEAAVIGRMLVTVAASDGVLDDAEHVELAKLFKALGLHASQLDAELAAAGLKSAATEPVVVRAGTPAKRGEPIPGAAAPPPAVALDEDAIRKILGDSQAVTTLLADILAIDDDTEDKDGDEGLPALALAPPANGGAAPASLGASATLLDVRYHAVAVDLVGQEHWQLADVKELATKHHLMPGAVLDALNNWSTDAYGDELIEEADGWRIHRDLIRERDTA